MGKKVLSLSLSEDLVDLLRSRAEGSGVSVSALVEQLLRRCIGEALEVEEAPEVRTPSDIEERLNNIEMQIQAIWRKFKELEEDEMMKEIFQGFREFLEEQERESGESG